MSYFRARFVLLTLFFFLAAAAYQRGRMEFYIYVHAQGRGEGVYGGRQIQVLYSGSLSSYKICMSHLWTKENTGTSGVGRLPTASSTLLSNIIVLSPVPNYTGVLKNKKHRRHFSPAQFSSPKARIVLCCAPLQVIAFERHGTRFRTRYRGRQHDYAHLQSGQSRKG